ncbi:hypothetical protein C8J56DRAFT_867218 [Mycena floridula]|nr:hypothetical protein C8J56DRAFT_867218 [Mycena floridula]
MRWSDLPPLETTLIPINIYDAITRVQEGIDTHMRRLSSEPPLLKFHPLDCHSQAACVEDWEAAWWMHMGKSLLNPLDPLIWSEALDRF